MDSMHVSETDWDGGWGVGVGGARDHDVPSLQPWAEIRQKVVIQSSTSGQTKGHRLAGRGHQREPFPQYCRSNNGGTVRSTAASQQEGRGFKSRMVQHVGACSRAFLCGVCMFSPCYPGSPRRTPTIKTCKKSRCSSVLTLTKSGPSTWTWSPGAASLAAHCSWMSLGEDSRMGKSREHLPPSCMCMCVCVPCCVAIKRACPPDRIDRRSSGLYLPGNPRARRSCLVVNTKRHPRLDKEITKSRRFRGSRENRYFLLET